MSLEHAGMTVHPERKHNPLQVGISRYLYSSNDDPGSKTGVDWRGLGVPRKYSTYPPLLLLPVNFSCSSPAWEEFYGALSPSQRLDLFSAIATAFKAQKITHIAINAPIAQENALDGESNIMRSPANITPVHGDFGPTHLQTSDQTNGQPSQHDFDAAFWVSATQNSGIAQTWAPLWTMFSRGNIAEKARILGRGDSFTGMREGDLGENPSQVDIVDFYIGIGYFAFSYLKWARRVFGWEINGWSVEGLRRGCQANGWQCLVIKLDDTGGIDEEDWQRLDACLPGEHPESMRKMCIVFWGDNTCAATVMADLQRRCIGYGRSDMLNVRHVNLGLLPSARQSWQHAIQVLDQRKGGWLHVHENAQIKEVDLRKNDIVRDFECLSQSARQGAWDVSCCHVGLVKTFAPGVGHFVFDIQILPAG